MTPLYVSSHFPPPGFLSREVRMSEIICLAFRGWRKRPSWGLEITGIPGFRLITAEEVSQNMKEQGGGEAEGIDAVHHTAVALNEGPPVFDAAVALDG